MQDVNQEASKLSFVYVPGEQLSLVVHIPHLLYYMNLWLGARNISKVTVTQIVDVYAVRFVLQWVFSAFFWFIHRVTMYPIHKQSPSQVTATDNSS